MNNLLSTEQIGEKSKYFNTPNDFFSNFPDAWKSVESQVLKLETRQIYYDPNWKEANKSFELYTKGEFEEATKLLYYFRSSDVESYLSLKEKKIDFIRCRPVEFPMVDYLKWEIECYHFNSFYGERIFFSKKSDLANIFTDFAKHDFMVFDRRRAFIHNYDEHGEIQGGWLVTNLSHIDSLIMLYSIIRAESLEYSIFLKRFDT